MRRRFVPTATWPLEERIAPSHAEVAAAAGLHATAHGSVKTAVTSGVDTNSQQATLSGSGLVAGLGAVGVAGQINSNFVNVQSFPDAGSITLTARKGAGTLVLDVTGPHSNLDLQKPTTVHLTYTVTSATGSFASYAGTHGTASLTLVTGGKTPPGFTLGTSTYTGTFFLVLRQA